MGEEGEDEGEEAAEATGPPLDDAEVCGTGVAEGALDEGAAFGKPGTIGLGAETPAISEPRPSFCKVGASSLPFASIPFED